jgi:flagellar basal body-associated protein FliL
VKLPIPRGRRAILALGLPLGLAAAGGFIYMQMSAAPSAPVKVPGPGVGQSGLMLVLEDRVINLTTVTAGGYKYAKLGVTIELRPEAAGFYDVHGKARTEEEATALEKYSDAQPRLLDALGSVVAAHDSATLNSATGRTKLKAELLESFRKILGEEEVLNIYFTNFLMQ